MDRPALVRAELERQKIIARAATEAGPPCVDCRHQIGSRCGNIAYAEQWFEPSTGKYIESYNTPTNAARSEEGMCGPEALLFEPKSALTVWLEERGSDIKTVATWAIFALIAAGLLADLLT